MILPRDIDAFYASVEERDNPAKRGKLVIGGETTEGRDVVAAAIDVVRKSGARSSMAPEKALQLRPYAIIIRPRMDHYAQISYQRREVLYHDALVLEPL